MRRMRRWRVLALAVAVIAPLVACGDDDAAAPPEPLQYVALGDSFSAGVGAKPYDAESGKCERSDLGFPPVLAEEADLVLLEVRACGGARTERFLEPWADRDEPAQIPSEPDAEVDLVTFTIGGNDAGFGDIVAMCVLGDCSGVPGSDDFTATLAALRATLVDDVYPALRAAYPEADLVHVGYPFLTPLTGDLPLECLWLSDDEQTAAVAIVAELNEALREAAADSGDADVAFVDVSEVFADHELCTDDSWVNPISLDSDRAHPTAEGYAAIAAAVQADLP